jgi:hypothetical protein
MTAAKMASSISGNILLLICLPFGPLKLSQVGKGKKG